jgi:hypothetical protein
MDSTPLRPEDKEIDPYNLSPFQQETTGSLSKMTHLIIFLKN